MRHTRKHPNDPAQAEFVGIIWQPLQHPFRLHAGDVIRFDGRLCRVIRVNECAAVIIMNRPVRDFKTRFDKPFRFQPPPAMFRISSQSAVEILNPKRKCKPMINHPLAKSFSPAPVRRPPPMANRWRFPGGQSKRACPVVFWKQTTIDDKQSGEPQKIPLLRYYHVFNVAQCDGIKIGTESAETTVNEIVKPDDIVAHMPQRPVIKHGIARAYYSPREDYVGLPVRERFEQAEGVRSVNVRIGTNCERFESCHSA